MTIKVYFYDDNNEVSGWVLEDFDVKNDERTLNQIFKDTCWAAYDKYLKEEKEKKGRRKSLGRRDYD